MWHVYDNESYDMSQACVSFLFFFQFLLKLRDSMPGTCIPFKLSIMTSASDIFPFNTTLLLLGCAIVHRPTYDIVSDTSIFYVIKAIFEYMLLSIYAPFREWTSVWWDENWNVCTQLTGTIHFKGNDFMSMDVIHSRSHWEGLRSHQYLFECIIIELSSFLIKFLWKI